MMSLKLKAKRSKKGLSGAVTALILVIASVIIALVVVGFAFGLFGALGGTPTITQVGTGTLQEVTMGGQTYYQATFTLQSTGQAQIVSAFIVGSADSVGAASITGYSLTTGINTVTIDFPTTGFNPQPGATYQISLGLTDGASVQVAVTYVGTA
jgi:hypothetical protein